jgi:nicotinic acid phosphoribosyltransferase
MKLPFDFPSPENLSLFTDFYELTMCASYFDNNKFEPATFDLFIRRLPPNRSYFLFAGLEQVLLYLENVHFTDEHITYLRKQGFDDDFLAYLRDFKFTGDVWAVPEGTVCFPNEPLIRVTAPIIEAQLVETFLLNTITLAAISKKVRALLDQNGLEQVSIFASGDLDEYKITELLEKDAKIDAFGVGTKMGTSADYPYLDVIYKLCETSDGKGVFSPIMKLSENKLTLPGRKQVYRFTDEEGMCRKDVIALADEFPEVGGEPLLRKVMESGKLCCVLPSLNEIRVEAQENLSKFPQKYHKLTDATTYPVELTPALKVLMEQLKEKIKEQEILNGVVPRL